MNYYIKGDKERGVEVIALLESKGGINVNKYLGNVSSCWYYINKDNIIKQSFSDEYLKEFCQEFILSENWVPKFKIGDEVDFITTLTHGTITEINSHEKTYTIRTGHIETVADEAHISLHKWEPKRGETVLVRDVSKEIWREAIFSFKGNYGYYVVGGNRCSICAPFDINKLGKTD